MRLFIALVLILGIIIFLLSGCATRYVCYDGTEQKDIKKCPIFIMPKVSEIQAGQSMDSYGYAYAQAKGDVYTRVNLYQDNGTWYSNALFANSVSGIVRNVMFKIDGKTANITCLQGCDYLGVKTK